MPGNGQFGGYATRYWAGTLTISNHYEISANDSSALELYTWQILLNNGDFLTQSKVATCLECCFVQDLLIVRSSY